MRQRRPLSALLALALFLMNASFAFGGDGQAVFSSLKCGMCHKAAKKAAAVSLADISKAYESKDKLVALFKSPDPKPLIETQKWGMMLPHFQDIRGLSEEEKGDLAEYIINAGNAK